MDLIQLARKFTGSGKSISDTPKIFGLILNQLREHNNQIEKLKAKMDKQISKVAKDVKGGKKKKAMKDIKVLKKMDKKFDAKVEKCDKKMMAKKK